MVKIEQVRYNTRNDSYRHLPFRFLGKIYYKNPDYVLLLYYVYSYIGYSGHVCEVIQPLVQPKIVQIGYAVALTYALADGIHKTSKELTV